jgi:hypothetical protein
MAETVLYATQQRQKVEGKARRKAQRQAIRRFAMEFEAKNKRRPTTEEVAVHFHRSHSWVWLLKRSAATDGDEEVGAVV